MADLEIRLRDQRREERQEVRDGRVPEGRRERATDGVDQGER